MQYAFKCFKHGLMVRARHQLGTGKIKMLNVRADAGADCTQGSAQDTVPTEQKPWSSPDETGGGYPTMASMRKQGFFQPGGQARNILLSTGYIRPATNMQQRKGICAGCIEAHFQTECISPLDICAALLR